MQVTLNITDKQLAKVCRQAQSVRQVLNVVRHEHSDYDKQWKARPATEYRNVRIAFAKAFLNRMVRIDRDNAVAYKNMMVNWVNEK